MSAQQKELKGENQMKVTNLNGTEIEFNAAVSMMDDEIRERMHTEGFSSEQEFFTAYEIAHEEKYDCEWELSKRNPTY